MNKKIILSSVLSLVLCLSLIAGGTFALFTDKAETNISITSANVDVEATIKNLAVYSPAAINLDGDITDKTNIADTTFANGGTATINGATLSLERMTPGDKASFDIVITNKSDVSIKYRTLLYVSADTGLFNGLKVTVDDDTLTMTQSSAWKTLEPGSDPIVVSVEVELPTTANDTYQGKSTQISFAVNAIQNNVAVTDVQEGDYVLYTATDLIAFANALNDAGEKNVHFENDIYLTAGEKYELITIKDNVTMNMGDNTLSMIDSARPSQDFAVTVNSADATLVINANENGGINTVTDHVAYTVCVAVRANGGTVVINGGTYISNDNAVYIYNVNTGKVIINGGFFQTTGSDPQDLINAGNVNPYEQLNQPAWIVITGGTFVNYDPSNAVRNGDNCNYVAEGYKVVTETQENGDIWYTVVPN